MNEALAFIASELDATEVRLIGKKQASDWFAEEILANLNTSYELTLPNRNRVAIDLDDDGDVLALSKLFVKDKGEGLGAVIMECLKDYAYSRDKMLIVVQVINPSFFRKFDWLDEDFTLDCRPLQQL